MTNWATDTYADADRFGRIAETDWNGLDPSAGPFVDWRFLAGLERAGCVGPGTGWRSLPLIESESGRPVCAAPAWLKDHSHGEFVFDWVWAHAAGQAGLAWYPKLLVAAPFSPVTGPRLLGADSHSGAAERLVERLESRVEHDGLSSAGINFCTRADAAVLRRAGWLERHDWQFHWRNPGYRDFDDFLSRLRRKPRKNIRAERKRVNREGWSFEWKDGNALTETDLDLADRCYQSTFAAYGNMPMLNRDFFAFCARRFGDRFLVCFARHRDRMLAAAIFWRDHSRLYGRYWGSLVETRDVHFETCYYQGIEYCIDHGLEWFEPGAQGEH
ncbi:MAG: GNAT family N-acetyltransferase, partial [Wenzhouxiangella sp.]